MKKNDEMIENIKKSDKDMTNKFAMRKYLQEEKIKLELGESEILKEQKRELNKFYNENSQQIGLLDS